MHPNHNNPKNWEREQCAESRGKNFYGRYPCPGKILPGSCWHSGVQICESGGVPDLFRHNPQASGENFKNPRYDRGRKQEFFHQCLSAQEPERGEAG